MTTAPTAGTGFGRRLLARNRRGRRPGVRGAVPPPARAGVYRFALHMTGIGGAADDVTQDVFMG